MPWKNKEKQRECHKKYYEANKDKVLSQVKEANKKLRARGKEFLFNYLQEHPCVDCGEADPIVLEFDHVRGEKIGDLKKMMYSYSIQNLQKEIEKCEVRCANCHRKATYKRRNNMETAKETGDKITPVEALR